MEIENDFLLLINSNKQMEKYLLHPPFDGNNIVINIFSRPTNEPELFYPDYRVFSIFNNQLEYGFRKEGADGGSSNLIYDTETKEEAKKLLRS